MDYTDPAFGQGHTAQVDDPEIGQASGDHQSHQSLGVGQMTLMQVEATAFLVSEEGLDAEALAIPGTGLGGVADIGDQVERLGVAFFPPADQLHRAIGVEGEADLVVGATLSGAQSLLVQGA